MAQFRGLYDKQAKLEFALVILHDMLTNNEKIIDASFDEGKAGEVLDAENIESLRTEAKAILPVKMMYGNEEVDEMRKFQNFRDRILLECGVS